MTSSWTPLERAALDGLAWELAATAPDLAGQIEEALPGQRRVQGPVILTETIVDRHRPNPPETTTGRLGTIHVQIDHLEHPIAFQVELLNGRLIALHGDAYGQDLARVDLKGDVVDQVFALRPDRHPVPYDVRDRVRDIREASPLRRLQANPDPEPPPPPASSPPDPTWDVLLGKKTPASPGRSLPDAPRAAGPDRPPSEVALELLFGRKTDAPPLHPTESTDEDLTSIRIGVVVLAGVLFAVLTFLVGLPFIFAGVVAFWVARLLLRKPAVEAIARALSQKRA